jgi:hypothetical protein
MQIIKPIDITEAVLVASSVPEDDYPPWDSTTSYLLGNRCLRNRRIYEALVANSGVDPAGSATNPATWLDLGMDNRWRMFDDKVGSQTAQAGGIAVTLQPNAVINALALFNLQGSTVTVTMTDPVEGEVYRRTLSLVDVGVNRWYDWFFAPIGRHTDLVLLDLPAYGTAQLNVTIDNAGDPAACGHLVAGTQVELGVALYGANAGITNYSRTDIDEFGNASVVERAYSKRASFDIRLDTARVATVQRLLASLRARPVVWIGEPSYEATIVFGFLKDFNLSISGPSISDGTLTIEGLV